jgi:hypothetical protein
MCRFSNDDILDDILSVISAIACAWYGTGNGRRHW